MSAPTFPLPDHPSGRWYAFRWQLGRIWRRCAGLVWPVYGLSDWWWGTSTTTRQHDYEQPNACYCRWCSKRHYLDGGDYFGDRVMAALLFGWPKDPTRLNGDSWPCPLCGVHPGERHRPACVVTVEQKAGLERSA